MATPEAGALREFIGTLMDAGRSRDLAHSHDAEALLRLAPITASQLRRQLGCAAFYAGLEEALIDYAKQIRRGRTS